jgi:imidazolonepropionase-like amidohydrolase
MADESAKVTAIKAGRIYTISDGVIENGIVLLRAGKIVGISRDGIVPEGADVIDASHSCVMPGMIDCYSYLGLHADALPAPAEPARSNSGPVSAKTRLNSALQADDPALAEALAGGVTAILLAPPAGGSVSGTASLIKPIQAPDRVDLNNPRLVKEAAAICFNLQGGSPRMAQPWVFEELLQGAKAYNQRRIQYVRDERQWEHDRDEAKTKKTDPPVEPAEVNKDEDQEPFAALFRGEIPAFVHANRSDEILTTLKVFRDENDLSLTIVGAADGFRVAEDIRKRGAGVAFGPEILVQDHGKLVDLPGAMSSAGVPVMLEGSSSSGTQFLRLNAANAVRNGMDPVAAIKAITLAPAVALHVQDRLGSIERGKDADLVILSGDPMEFTSRVEKVLVNGKVVFDSHAKQ